MKFETIVRDKEQLLIMKKCSFSYKSLKKYCYFITVFYNIESLNHEQVLK